MSLAERGSISPEFSDWKRSIKRDVSRVLRRPVRAVTKDRVYVGESQPPGQLYLGTSEIRFLMEVAHGIEELRSPELLFPLIVQKKKEFESNPSKTGRVRASRRSSKGLVWFGVADDLVREHLRQNGISEISQSQVYASLRLALTSMRNELNLNSKGVVASDKFISRVDQNPSLEEYTHGMEVACICPGKGIARLWHSVAMEVFDKVKVEEIHN